MDIEIEIADDAFELAEQYAHAHGLSLDEAISTLICKARDSGGLEKEFGPSHAALDRDH